MESDRTAFCKVLQQGFRRRIFQHFTHCHSIRQKFIFAGLMPSEIEKRFPDKWFNDNEEGNKNEHEREF